MNTLAGTGGIIRLILRRNRWLMPLWIVWLTLVPVNFAAAFANLYPTLADRQEYARTSGGNASLVALFGPLFGSSVGALLAWRVSIAAVIVGLISLLTTIRHTRTEEEAGRRELLGATVVGRHADTAAALITTCGANIVLAVLLALGLTTQDLPAGGSLLLGLQVAAVGWVFAAVGAVAAQLTESAGTARGLATGTLGVALLLRIGGDLSDHGGGGLGWLSWLSPLGWAVQIRPYAGGRWWLVALLAVLTLLLAAVAVVLSARRDLGAGILPPRPGPATAAPRLRGPFALAWRLHRALLIGWVAGFAMMGAVLGGAASGAGDMLTDNQDLHEVFARIGGQGRLVDTFLAAMAGVYGLIAACYAVQAALRLLAEETSLRGEPVLATTVSRLRWATSHLFFAAAGPAVALLAAGATTGLVRGLDSGDVGRELPRVMAAAVVQLPAVWLLAAIAVVFLGLLPRLTTVTWAAIAVAATLGLFGAALQLDQRLLDISPFTHIPKLPGNNASLTPLAWLLGISALLTTAGLLGLRRRDTPIS